MENEFDWSILENDNTERVKSFKEEIVDKTHLKIELAFHEASHFVFDCISSKFVCGFSPINFIISCADKLHENGFNRVDLFKN